MPEPSRLRSYDVYLIETPDCWYVGSTVRGLERRFRMHMGGYGNAPLLAEQVANRGPEAFSIRCLESGIGDPMPAERAWYDRYLANDPRLSLNTRRPGAFPDHDEVTRAKISASKTGAPSPMKGKTFSQETRERMRAGSPHLSKTHCRHGHPFDEENTYRSPSGWRRCRTCRAAQQKAIRPEVKRAKMRADVARRRERYANDLDYRARLLAANRADRKHRKTVG